MFKDHFDYEGKAKAIRSLLPCPCVYRKHEPVFAEMFLGVHPERERPIVFPSRPCASGFLDSDGVIHTLKGQSEFTAIPIIEVPLKFIPPNDLDADSGKYNYKLHE